jgi:hypothetical protein
VGCKILQAYKFRKENDMSVKIDRIINSTNPVMQVNGLNCILNMPPAIKQQFIDGQELTCNLPPYNRRSAFVVDEYPACPPNWMRGSGEVSSYFVPVLSEHGLWLDFNENRHHTHDIAVVVSIQGINAITGQKTDKLRLEQYKKKCPIHKKIFGHEKFCEECGFKWPAQNYLASNVTPNGYFWLDGFRSQDGEVRQYIFTEEVVRGVAAQLIGEERVFAIGIAFYLSKEPKKIPDPVTLTRGVMPIVGCSPKYGGSGYGGSNGYIGIKGAKGNPNFYTPFSTVVSNSATPWMDELICSASVAPIAAPDSIKYSVQMVDIVNDPLLTLVTHHDFDSDCVESVEPIETTKLEISAGAKIHQSVHTDIEKLNYWQKEPVGVIYINYVPVEDAEKIIEAGRRDMTGKGEGFMQGLKVGSSVEE